MLRYENQFDHVVDDDRMTSGEKREAIEESLSNMSRQERFFGEGQLNADEAMEQIGIDDEDELQDDNNDGGGVKMAGNQQNQSQQENVPALQRGTLAMEALVEDAKSRGDTARLLELFELDRGGKIPSAPALTSDIGKMTEAEVEKALEVENDEERSAALEQRLNDLHNLADRNARRRGEKTKAELTAMTDKELRKEYGKAVRADLAIAYQDKVGKMIEQRKSLKGESKPSRALDFWVGLGAGFKVLIIIGAIALLIFGIGNPVIVACAIVAVIVIGAEFVIGQTKPDFFPRGRKWVMCATVALCTLGVLLVLRASILGLFTGGVDDAVKAAVAGDKTLVTNLYISEIGVSAPNDPYLYIYGVPLVGEAPDEVSERVAEILRLDNCAIGSIANSVYCDEKGAVAVAMNMSLSDALKRINGGETVKCYAITDYGEATNARLMRVGS